ncbi:MAG: transglutaminase domain-containing protein [Chloroflexi bacterium]|nr:transglutaminase domain-containing protein [Chloroflexota bacterium]
MTSDTLSVVAPARTRALLAGPRVGWTSVLLVLVMLLATGIAIDDLGWVTLAHDRSATAWLPWLMLIAGGTGALLAMSRLGQGWVDLLAAVVGTVVGLVAVAGAVSESPDLVTRLRDLNLSMSTALDDILVVRARTAEASPFLLTLSALAWTTGAFAAIGVVRRAHAPSAIVPIGLLLIVPMLVAERVSPTGAPLLWLTVVAGAGLLLALRLNLERQRTRWLRRQVLGGRGVGSLFLRGGSVMVALVLTLAVTLTAVAGTAPLSASWQRLVEALDDLGLTMGGLVGTSDPPPAGSSLDLPRSQRASDQWQPGEGPAFTVRVEEGTGHYWRLGAYDRLEGDRLSQTGGLETAVISGGDLLEANNDLAGFGLATIDVTATVTLADEGARVLPAPQAPLELDRDARLVTMGEEGAFQRLEAAVPPGPGQTYVVQSLALDLSAEGVTIHELGEADDTPDPEWTRSFLTVAPGDLGPDARRLATAIRRSVGDGPSPRYRIAHAIQERLRADGIYDTDIRDLCARGESIPDCLVRTQRGFCVQFAWTMVLMLRHIDIPARYVQGYLPGTPIAPGQWEVPRSAAHAWVEVYFPGIGWLPFDPTPADGGGDLASVGQAPTELTLGAPIGPDPTPGPDDPDRTPEPDPTDGPLPTDDPGMGGPSPEPSPGAGVVPTDDGGSGLPRVPLLVGLLLGGTALGGGLLLLVWLRRLPGGRTDRAWEGVVSLATHLGRGPRPSQTPYEYSDSLARVVPRSARELRAVADAQVDARYGGRVADPGALAGVRRAYARARVGLLALLFRRR